MNTFSYPQSAESKNPSDPLTFTYNKSNKINIEENSNDNNKKDTIQSDKNKNLDEVMIFDGQGTKESKDILYKEDAEEDIEGDIEENIIMVDKKKDENYKEFKNYDDGNIEDDDFYYISELIPPQNFSLKLRLAKKRHQELQKKINSLKKEIKKYNPNFPIRDYNNYIP